MKIHERELENCYPAVPSITNFIFALNFAKRLIVVLLQVIIMMFAMGIMLMIGAQVARGESSPGLTKYMKEIKKIRDSTMQEHYRRCEENRKRKSFERHHPPRETQTLVEVDEIDVTEPCEQHCNHKTKEVTEDNPSYLFNLEEEGEGDSSDVARFTLGGAQLSF